MCPTVFGHGDPVTSAKRSSKSPCPHDTTSVQATASTPPAERSRAARSNPTLGSTQCHALNATMASAALRAEKSSNRPPEKLALSPSFSCANSRMPSDGSIAKTCRPRSTNASVPMPVPAPISTTSAPGVQLTQLHDVVEHGIGIAGTKPVIGNSGLVELLRSACRQLPDVRHGSSFPHGVGTDCRATGATALPLAPLPQRGGREGRRIDTRIRCERPRRNEIAKSSRRSDDVDTCTRARKDDSIPLNVDGARGLGLRRSTLREPACHLRERELRRTGPSVLLRRGQGQETGRRRQVARRVVEHLGREPPGAVVRSFGQGDARDALHERVEPSTLRPRAFRAPGRKGDDAEMWMPLGQRLRRQTESGQRAGPVALDEQVRRTEQLLQTGPACGFRRGRVPRFVSPTACLSRAPPTPATGGCPDGGRSAPHAANVRVAIGPASTLVKSSTRIPSATRPGPRPVPALHRRSSPGAAGRPRPRLGDVTAHCSDVRHGVPERPGASERFLQVLGTPCCNSPLDAAVAVLTAQHGQRSIAVPRILAVDPEPCAVGSRPEEGQGGDPILLGVGGRSGVVLAPGRDRHVLAVDQNGRGCSGPRTRVEDRRGQRGRRDRCRHRREGGRGRRQEPAALAFEFDQGELAGSPPRALHAVCRRALVGSSVVHSGSLTSALERLAAATPFTPCTIFAFNTAGSTRQPRSR